MSCGTRITGRFGDSWLDREELAEKLESDGEYRLARMVKHGECLDDYDRRRAERSLENQGLMKYHDFHERECACSPEGDDAA